MSQHLFNLSVEIISEKLMHNTSLAKKTHDPLHQVGSLLNLRRDTLQKIMQNYPLTFFTNTYS
jgi:hypothetical protein